MLRNYLAAALMPLAGCQTMQNAAPDALRAACLSQQYLNENGFLRAQPEGAVALLQTDLRYEEDGDIDHAQLRKDRLNSFSGKLHGVWTTAGHTKFIVVYEPRRRKQRCVGVTGDFSFAYFLDSCAGTGAFTELHERSLPC